MGTGQPPYTQKIVFLSLQIFVLANSVDTDEVPHPGFSLFAKVHVWEVLAYGTEQNIIFINLKPNKHDVRGAQWLSGSA